MLSSGQEHDSCFSLGQRRGVSDLARFALDLTWARADSESAFARSDDYPSPPMSGSPPVHQRATQEVAEQWSQQQTTTAPTTAPTSIATAPAPALPASGPVLAPAPAPILPFPTPTPISTTTGTSTIPARQDVYRRPPPLQTSAGEPRPGPQAATTPLAQVAPSPYPPVAEGLERMPFAFSRPEASLPKPMSYHSHSPYNPAAASSSHQHHPLLAGPGSAHPGHGYGPLPAPQPYGPPHPHYPAQELAGQTSPKTQRKTKGHVASACVPCKRAHLRCDAQRPCSRCMSNGKEDSCVDVQHKKRGRPRLRDDREASKYEAGAGTAAAAPSSRYGSAAAAAPEPLMRRPMSMYAAGPSAAGGGIATAFDDSLRRTQSQSYRVIKSSSHGPEPVVAPRFPERGSAADANFLPPPLSIPPAGTRQQQPPPHQLQSPTGEPAAFLTMDLEFKRASPAFLEVIGRHAAAVLSQGRGARMRLGDLVTPVDRERAHMYRRQLMEEQKRREPHYLPPIFGREEEERVMQTLGFGRDELGRYTIDRLDSLTFVDQDGQARLVHFGIGLAKKESIYFVVMLLQHPASARQYQYPTPSPIARESPFSYQSQSQQQSPYAQRTPISATFSGGARHTRFGSDSAFGLPRAVPPGPPPPLSAGAPMQLMTGLSPTAPSSYAASPTRPDYGIGMSPYQIPRSELQPQGRPPTSPAAYQLAPIRDLQQQQQQQQHRQHHHRHHDQPSQHHHQQQPYGLPQPPPQQLQHSSPRPTGRDSRSRVDIGGLLDRPDPSLQGPRR